MVDPIPNSLAKSEGTICLDDMVSTEQIMTDHTRISPRKIETTQQNHDSESNLKHKSKTNGIGGEHLKNLETDFETCLKKKTKDVQSSSGNENGENAEEEKSDFMCARKCENKSFLNECTDNKIGLGWLCNQESKEKIKSKFQVTGKSRSSFDKGKIVQEKKYLNRSTKYEPRNLKGEKKIPKKKESSFKVHIPKLDEFLSQNMKGNSKSFEEKKNNYGKYLEEKGATVNREKIIVTTNPFVWKKEEKEELLSMIDKILTLDGGFDEEVEKDSEKKKVNSACAEVQTESFDFLPDMKGDSTLTTQTQNKDHVRKNCDTHRVLMHDTYKESESKVLDWKKQSKDSQYPSCSENEYGIEHACNYRDHESGSNQDGGWSNEEIDSFDTLCEEEVDFEKQDSEEEEQTFFEYPYIPNSNHSTLNNHCLGEQYPPFSFYPYNSFGYLSPAQMSRDHRKQLFNYQLSLSLYQQNNYISAMLGHLY